MRPLRRGPGAGPAAPAHDPGPAALVGNDRLLADLVLGVMSFWLFAQTMLNVAPVVGADLVVGAGPMNVAVALTSLFAGIFVVVMGGLADRVGRVRMTCIGFALGIAGAVFVALTPQGTLAVPVLLTGRALQGLSAACIMPASLVLLKAGWDGAGRQRAISMWSIGTWGGAGLCSLVGGLMAEGFGWRSIFWTAALVGAAGLLLVRGTPESKAPARADWRFDLPGVLAFLIAMLALQALVVQGGTIGWTSPLSLGLMAAAVGAGAVFVVVEQRSSHAFFDFRLFRNRTYAGATVSNLPAEQGGAGAGIYKMGSSLGAAFGVSLSAAVFTDLSGAPGGAGWLDALAGFTGRQDNLALREAALVALGCNLAMVALAMVAVLIAVPAGKRPVTAR